MDNTRELAEKIDPVAKARRLLFLQKQIGKGVPSSIEEYEVYCRGWAETIARAYLDALDELAEEARINGLGGKELLDPDMPAQQLRLHMGEITANEVLVARAAIRLANSVAVRRELALLARTEQAERALENHKAKYGPMMTDLAQENEGLREALKGYKGILEIYQATDRGARAALAATDTTNTKE